MLVALISVGVPQRAAPPQPAPRGAVRGAATAPAAPAAPRGTPTTTRSRTRCGVTSRPRRALSEQRTNFNFSEINKSVAIRRWWTASESIVLHRAAPCCTSAAAHHTRQCGAGLFSFGPGPARPWALGRHLGRTATSRPDTANVPSFPFSLRVSPFVPSRLAPPSRWTIPLAYVVPSRAATLRARYTTRPIERPSKEKKKKKKTTATPWAGRHAKKCSLRPVRVVIMEAGGQPRLARTAPQVTAVHS